MESRVAQAKGICHVQCLIRQHTRLYAMHVSTFCDFFGCVGTYSNHLHTTLIEFSAQFFQPT